MLCIGVGYARAFTPRPWPLHEYLTGFAQHEVAMLRIGSHAAYGSSGEGIE
jgi:hypothetical protein